MVLAALQGEQGTARCDLRSSNDGGNSATASPDGDSSPLPEGVRSPNGTHFRSPEALEGGAFFNRLGSLANASGYLAVSTK